MAYSLTNDPALTKCYRCGAFYRPGGWRYGHWGTGTEGRFTAHGKIPDDHCPCCRKPPKLEPDPEYPMTM